MRLRETVNEWKRGCQIAVDKAWKKTDTKNAVQQLAYDKIRERTTLGSQHTVLACHRAAENIASCKSQQQAGKKVSKPEYGSPTVTYDSRSLTLFPDEEQVSLTVAGNHQRVRCKLELPGNSDGYQYEYLNGESWDTTESTLHFREGEWFLHIGFRKPTSQNINTTTKNGTVLGVDLGIEELAVTSTAQFFSGSELNHRRQEFERTRGNLQQTDSRSARRTLRSLAGREREYVKHVLHRVAKNIVKEACKHSCDGIIFEDLSQIRERLPNTGWHAEWAFKRIHKYVEYKAAENSLFVEEVSPENTSIRCAECGSVEQDNRTTRGWFECQKCGNRNHADYNAAKNIASKYLRGGQQSSCRRGISQYALKSGTVDPNQGFQPYSEQFADKSY